MLRYAGTHSFRRVYSPEFRCSQLSQRKADLESQRNALKRDIDRMQRADLMGAAAPQLSVRDAAVGTRRRGHTSIFPPPAGG